MRCRRSPGWRVPAPRRRWRPPALRQRPARADDRWSSRRTALVTSLQRAKILALIVPAGLLAGAFGSEIWGGLFPCEMCWWQRYAHFAALAAAILAFALARLPDRGRSFVWLAAFGILTSGAIGAYHAGVEAG